MNFPLTNLIIDPKRKCGPCRACCTLLAVPEIAKEAGTRCQHECGDGCGIYESRPAQCKGFYCAWRLGYFTDADRPDKIGVMFSLRQNTKFTRGNLLIADEVRPGARIESRPAALLQQESLHQLVLVRVGGERKLLGPPEELERVYPLLAEAAEHARL